MLHQLFPGSQNQAKLASTRSWTSQVNFIYDHQAIFRPKCDHQIHSFQSAFQKHGKFLYYYQELYRLMDSLK